VKRREKEKGKRKKQGFLQSKKASHLPFTIYHLHFALCTLLLLLLTVHCSLLTAKAADMNLERTNHQGRSEYTIDLNRPSGNSQTIDLSENDAFVHFVNATDKFVQCNIRSSWEDFKTLINTAQENDFLYISFADKMADLGLFDLANLAVSKIKDKDIAGVSIDAMKRFYYPEKPLKLDDELFLAETYSNILYNNQSFEATNELIQNAQLMSTSDYANYLAALGYYKSNNFKSALKYIDIATSQNSSTLNYQKLRAEILAELNSPEDALKVVDNLKKQHLNSSEYENKIASLEQFVLYKIKKTDWEKNYHLGYYHYLENDSSKAVRTLQSALFGKGRHDNGDIYGLMSQVYLSVAESEKASDTAKKSLKANRNNPKALATMGDLSYKNKNYKQALAYYKKAENSDKKSCTILIKEAEAYQKLFNKKKTQEIYTKILKTHSDIAEAYYNTALLSSSDNEKQIAYLKKALAINPLYESAWVELARINMKKENYYMAQKYLANVFYIDENDFRYYYYQGLLDVNNNNFSQAKYNFKKCLKLNANYNQAQEALDNILKNEDGNIQVQL
jgi:tetratricopeptide (TPR) repeat protein